MDSSNYQQNLWKGIQPKGKPSAAHSDAQRIKALQLRFLRLRQDVLDFKQPR